MSSNTTWAGSDNYKCIWNIFINDGCVALGYNNGLNTEIFVINKKLKLCTLSRLHFKVKMGIWWRNSKWRTLKKYMLIKMDHNVLCHKNTWFDSRSFLVNFLLWLYLFGIFQLMHFYIENHLSDWFTAKQIHIHRQKNCHPFSEASGHSSQHQKYLMYNVIEWDSFNIKLHIVSNTWCIM